ncbi:hypothetical protein CI102_5007 [Trichoderma harzianum]|jgi:hypothetical protein|nr:hypothetical protein CI102_5007 [Trichoderma harzianum]
MLTPPTPNLGKRWGVFCVSLFHNSRLFIKVRLDKSCGWLDCSDGDTFGVDGTHQEGGQRTGVFCLLRHWRVAGQPSAGGGRLCMPFTTVLVLVQGGNTFTHWLWFSKCDGLWRIRIWRKAHGVKPRQYFGPLLGISDSHWRDFASGGLVEMRCRCPVRSSAVEACKWIDTRSFVL